MDAGFIEPAQKHDSKVCGLAGTRILCVHAEIKAAVSPSDAMVTVRTIHIAACVVHAQWRHLDRNRNDA